MSAVEVFYRIDGPFCQNCFAVKRTLTKLDVPFEVKELTDEMADEYKADSRFMQQPIVIYAGHAHAGFHPAKLEQIAKDYRYFEGGS